MDFEDKLQEQLDKLPYKKHVDDGQYNDGQLDGFEAGARWAFALYNVVGQSEQLICKCDEPADNAYPNGTIFCENCGLNTWAD